jgi:hypothetical protein
MNTNTPNVFVLNIIENQISNIFDLIEKKPINRFSSPLSGKGYKLYVLTYKDKIIYVGTTKSSLKNRLREGLKKNGQNGYHGYKWKKLTEVKLLVWCFEDYSKEKVENVEAELVFMVRNITGKWPDYQNEIHFNNLFTPTGQQVAENVYAQITERILNGD